MTSNPHILPDLVRPGLKILIVGTAVGPTSAARGHYYAGPGNRFWEILHSCGLTAARFSPENDHLLPELGIGLTDLNKIQAQGNDVGLKFDVPGFIQKVEDWKPQVVAFHGKNAAKTVARHFHQPEPDWGLLNWTIGDTRTFVVPQTSGANRRPSYGRHERIEGWWRELAELS